MKVSGEIYIVCGECGEYSDRHEWDVAAFNSQDKANLFRDLVQRKYQQNRARFKNKEERYRDRGDCPPPEPSHYAFEEDPDAPIEGSYEATYSVTPVKFNPKF